MWPCGFWSLISKVILIKKVEGPLHLAMVGTFGDVNSKPDPAAAILVLHPKPYLNPKP